MNYAGRKAGYFIRRLKMAFNKRSKNARSGVIKQANYCKCGGEIGMKTVFINGKMKNFAECKSCGATARRPRDLKI